MTVTRLRIVGIFIAANLIYWVPALPFPDQMRGAVNAALMILSLMTSMTLVPDMFDIWLNRGDGLSWQALVAKTGLFLLSLSFFLTRLWALFLAEQNYPDDLLHGPVSGYLAYLMGLGMFGIFFGFNSVGAVAPQMSIRGIVAAALIIGIIVGVVISRLPV
jgi:hypothetical protein